jgi:hypothetical protein
MLENHYDRLLGVTFESSDLIPQNGPLQSASHVGFEPGKLELPPGRQAEVRVIVSITPDFAVGQTYTATIRLLGFEAKEMGLSVTVLPPAGASEFAGSPPGGGKTAKKRRAQA